MHRYRQLRMHHCQEYSSKIETLSTQIELNEAVRLYHVNQESQLVINSKSFQCKSICR